jgi:hypothetical protein
MSDLEPGRHEAVLLPDMKARLLDRIRRATVLGATRQGHVLSPQITLALPLSIPCRLESSALSPGSTVRSGQFGRLGRGRAAERAGPPSRRLRRRTELARAPASCC